MRRETARFQRDTGFVLEHRKTTDARQSRRGTEVPRPFGSVHEGASALANLYRTVGVYVDRNDRRELDSIVVMRGVEEVATRAATSAAIEMAAADFTLLLRSLDRRFRRLSALRSASSA